MRKHIREFHILRVIFDTNFLPFLVQMLLASYGNITRSVCSQWAQRRGQTRAVVLDLCSLVKRWKTCCCREEKKANVAEFSCRGSSRLHFTLKMIICRSAELAGNG